jgi:hypothetical protein
LPPGNGHVRLFRGEAAAAWNNLTLQSGLCYGENSFLRNFEVLASVSQRQNIIMAENYDEEIIELTEVVEQDDAAGDDDFLKELENGSFLDQSSAAPEPNDSGEDEVSKFFSSGPVEPEEVEAQPADEAELMPEAPSQEAGSEDDFASFLEDIEEDLQMKQTPKAEGGKDQAILAIEKQWEETLEGPDAVEDETGEPDLLQETTPAAEPSHGADDDLNQVQAERQAAPVAVTVSEEMLEAAVTKAVKQVLEPLAERVFAETAERILTREIERLTADIKGVEDEIT